MTKILLIEDNSDDIYLLKIALSEAFSDFDLKTINNGKAAIDYLFSLENKNEPLPDLIILDINLPILNGLEVWPVISNFA